MMLSVMLESRIPPGEALVAVGVFTIPYLVLVLMLVPGMSATVASAILPGKPFSTDLAE